MKNKTLSYFIQSKYIHITKTIKLKACWLKETHNILEVGENKVGLSKQFPATLTHKLEKYMLTSRVNGKKIFQRLFE